MNKTAAVATAKKWLTIAKKCKDASQKALAVRKAAEVLKEAGVPVGKTAFSEDSRHFVEWCLMKNEKLSVAEVQRTLDRAGVPFFEATESKRGTLEVGDKVKVSATVNTNQLNTMTCEEHDGHTGIVTQVLPDAVMVEFDFGKGSAKFEGKEPGKATGLGRHTPISEDAQKRPALEVVYISDKATKPPSKLQLKLVQDYVDKGLAAGESRFDVYYTGLGLKQSENKQGQYYFTTFAAQRDQYPRSFNPLKGQVLYVGLLGKRPGGWRAEYEQMVAEASDVGEAD